ncbi:hypothetical protein Fmac_023350 [Flemingia macrophylla]|uniref:B-like cyclin n=1 Tax=Flemingia macrophylla TaxID=520843 RepID=A0ABD1LL90_9FABA
MSPSPDSSTTQLTSQHLPPPPPQFHDHDASAAAITALLLAESQHMPENDYLGRCRDRSVDVTGRLDAVNWILKVHAFYEFRPVTAFLSVNYLDRFLSRCSLPRASGWPFQLLSVACLSLAAKMEESHVPFLLDLQLFQPKFIFEPKTLQRMELWVMSNLDWRLRSVTPFDYLHHFISCFPSSSSSSSFTDHFNAASTLILSTTRVLDFLAFPPSAVAAAAVLCSAPPVAQLPLTFHGTLNKEMVRCCHQLMEDYVLDTCLASTSAIKAQIAEAAPPSSPVGVLDAATCASCDTPFAASGHQQQEADPPNKRLRSSTPDAPPR